MGQAISRMRGDTMHRFIFYPSRHAMNRTLCARFFFIMKPSTNRLWSGRLPSTVITFIAVLSELICVPQHCCPCSSAAANDGNVSAVGENSSVVGDATAH